LENLIYFDGGGSGIRAQSLINDIKSEVKHLPGFSHGEVDLVDYLSKIVIDFANGCDTNNDIIARAVLAVATLPSDSKQFELIAQSIFKSTTINELWICSDSVSSSMAEIDNDGVVITVGTGITSLAVGNNRTKIHTLSGDGYLISDKASAFWIGREGLSLATRAFDGRDQSEDAKMLLDLACTEFNTQPYFLPHVVHQQDRAVNAIAHFAKQVSRLAENGNLKAIEIIDEAASEIALIASTAKRVCGQGDFQVALIGGVVSKGTLIRKLSEAKISDLGMKMATTSKTPLDGAGLLAGLAEPGVFSPLIKIFKRV
jgi:N-acetylglucosamine kinase-like BadF-type ATPase